MQQLKTWQAVHVIITNLDLREMLGKFREDSHTKLVSGGHKRSPYWACSFSMQFLPPSSNSKLVLGMFFNAHNAVDAVRVRPQAKKIHIKPDQLYTVQHPTQKAQFKT